MPPRQLATSSSELPTVLNLSVLNSQGGSSRSRELLIVLSLKGHLFATRGNQGLPTANSSELPTARKPSVHNARLFAHPLLPSAMWSTITLPSVT